MNRDNLPPKPAPLPPLQQLITPLGKNGPPICSINSSVELTWGQREALWSFVYSTELFECRVRSRPLKAAHQEGVLLDQVAVSQINLVSPTSHWLSGGCIQPMVLRVGILSREQPRAGQIQFLLAREGVSGGAGCGTWGRFLA
ncbi:rab GTPase-binding effector protein 1 [Platysternon megacephalum]|uniref:Rab GTPase-binding effector protein 1 n=1 Tax=Platysternon megacephalum TaxID=55544 RepID=A0A4D9ERG1_9SAUR|nr:rab GTPase-binding effector protein 1 [Platysternon megacephalum]